MFGDGFYCAQEGDTLVQFREGRCYSYNPDRDDWLPDTTGRYAYIREDHTHWESLSPSLADNRIQALLRRQKARLHQAMEFAALAHREQLRKGTDIPYIAHPFEVAQILTEAAAPHSVCIAGLLHDTVEDAGVTLEEIEASFGPRVTQLVAACSENKADSWEDRKSHTIASLLAEEDPDILLLACGDKLANLRSLRAEWERMGDAVWNKFRRGREQQSWYYSRLIDALSPLQEYEMYWELNSLYGEIFVRYYTNRERSLLVQTNGQEAYSCSRSTGKWGAIAHPEQTIAAGLLHPLSRAEAIDLEDRWVDAIEAQEETADSPLKSQPLGGTVQ